MGCESLAAMQPAAIRQCGAAPECESHDLRKMASAATARDKHVTAGVRVLRGIAEARTYGPVDAIMCRRMRCATDATRVKEQKINPLFSRDLSAAAHGRKTKPISGCEMRCMSSRCNRCETV